VETLISDANSSLRETGSLLILIKKMHKVNKKNAQSKPDRQPEAQKAWSPDKVITCPSGHKHQPVLDECSSSYSIKAHRILVQELRNVP